MWWRKPKPQTPDLTQEIEKFRTAMTELKGQLLFARRQSEMIETKLGDSQEAVLSLVKQAEEAAARVLLSNDAQAHRYIELKKRLDKYDTTFQQLGILIAQQRVAPADSQPSVPPTPER